MDDRRIRRRIREALAGARFDLSPDDLAEVVIKALDDVIEPESDVAEAATDAAIRVGIRLAVAAIYEHLGEKRGVR